MCENIQIYNCEFCCYFSNKKYNLTRHLKIHDLQKPNIKKNNECVNNELTTNENLCLKCYKVFSSKYTLKRHDDICKGVSSSLVCQYCNKIFAYNSSKLIHIKKCKIKKIQNEKSNEEIIIHNNNQILNNCTFNNNTTINNTINNNIIVFDPINVNGTTLKTDHINLDFISRLLKIKEKDVLTLYKKKLFDNPDNRCIKKTNLRSLFSEIHVGQNQWDICYDIDIYPKFISEISNCLCELLTSKVSNKKIINKLIEFLDYMAEEGHCNQEDISEEIKKEYKSQIQKTKAIIYNISKYID
jgi:hypothetical protein